MHAMSATQTLDDAIAAQRGTIAAVGKRLSDLQEVLQTKQDERAAIANDPTTYGVHSNGKLDKADQAIRNVQGQIAEAEQEVQNATHVLQHLERVQERQAKAGTSKTAALAERVRALRTTIAAMDERGQQLVTAMVDDPDNDGLHEDIALNNEKRKTALEQLELYEQAHAAAVIDDQASAEAARTLDAFIYRDQAVSLAQQRVAVAERIDSYLAGLAPLMREWREVDEATATAVVEALRALCAGADLETRSRVMQKASRAATRNSIAPAVVQALLLADVQDVTRDLLEFRFASAVNAKRNPITAKDQAARTIPALVSELDEAILKAGVQRG